MSTHFIEEVELAKNSNAQFGLTLQLQKVLASENTHFMIELARELKCSYTVPTLALHISTVFFHKKSYLNYDRFLILTACFLLASKLKNVECRLKGLCSNFYTVISRVSHNIQPFNEQKMKQIKQHISIYETQILRTLQFDIEIITPHEYVKKQCDLLYAGEKEISRKIFSTTRILILDSYRSRCCLVFHPIIIFISCFLIANRYEGVMPYKTQAVRQSCEETNPTQQKLYETWLKMISLREHQEISAAHIRDCLKLINSVLLIC